MIWDRERLEGYLKDKQQRSIHIDEYILLIEFINQIRPTTFIDIGTYLGTSCHILGTCCDSINNVYTIDNIDSVNYTEKEESKKEDHGIYVPSNCIFLKNGYENGILDSLIKDGNEFVLWDAGKNTLKVYNQIELSHKLKIKYISIHDSGLIQNTVRRAINQCIRRGWYKIIKEDIESDPKKGVSILELVDY